MASELPVVGAASGLRTAVARPGTACAQAVPGRATAVRRPLAAPTTGSSLAIRRGVCRTVSHGTGRELPGRPYPRWHASDRGYRHAAWLGARAMELSLLRRPDRRTLPEPHTRHTFWDRPRRALWGICGSSSTARSAPQWPHRRTAPRRGRASEPGVPACHPARVSRGYAGLAA